MRDLVSLILQTFQAAVTGLRTALAPGNRRLTAAVVLGGATIAAANWFAMSKPPGESVAGLGPDSAAGALFAPMYGGIVAGLVAGFSKRPLYADGRVGTLAAFAGMAMLLVWVGVVRLTGDLPESGLGFTRFGPISGAMFVLVIGAANTFITFPTAFLVIFASRSVVPNNKHRYGWLQDDDDNPGLHYVTPGPTEPQGDLRRHSTAYSRFKEAPPRFSKIPRRFIDGRRE